MYGYIVRALNFTSPALSWLDTELRALHQYRRGHGFEYFFRLYLATA